MVLTRGCFDNLLMQWNLPRRLPPQSSVEMCATVLHCLSCRSSSSENIRFTPACDALWGFRA